MRLYKQMYSTPIGEMSLVACEEGLVGAWFLNQKYFEKSLDKEPENGQNHHLDKASELLTAYFKGETVDFSSLALCPSATIFQKRVWEHLQKIPFGETVTYGEIAQALHIQSSQAVGGAVGRNPLSIIIPCHRVLGRDGRLTGYAGGLDKKVWLLQHEKVLLDKGAIDSLS